MNEFLNINDFCLPVDLIGSCIEQMKHIHAQLNVDSLKPGKAQKKKVTVKKTKTKKTKQTKTHKQKKANQKTDMIRHFSAFFFFSP